MSLLVILHIVNIIVIMALICHLLFKISEMKYSVYWSIVRYLRFKDSRGVNWIGSNYIYVFYILLVCVLCMINITLIGQLMNNSIFNRPIFLLMLSPIAWTIVLIHFKYVDWKLKEN